MNQSDFKYLENKILSDREFTKELTENPEQALKRAGIPITPEVLNALQGVDGSAFDKLARTLQWDEAEQ
jgi:hypothetical protein